MQTLLMASTLGGRYVLGKSLGGGAFGGVWAARDKVTGTQVAVKVAHPNIASNDDLRARFEKEIRVVRRVQSPHVCRALDSGQTDDGLPYLVLERLVGETLDARIAREGPLAVRDVAILGDAILLALVAAHAVGVVHRDLGPRNVFLADVPKVLDFGIAKTLDASIGRTGDKVMMGSMGFVAPEQLDDAVRAGPRADLYALGSVLFYALTGRLPFGDLRGMKLLVMKKEHDPPSIEEATGQKWPRSLVTFLQKCMARQPSRRYASAEIALVAFRAATREGPALPMVIPPAPKTETTTMTFDPPTKKR